jgi:hypothetical protein
VKENEADGKPNIAVVLQLRLKVWGVMKLEIAQAEFVSPAEHRRLKTSAQSSEKTWNMGKQES